MNKLTQHAIHHSALVLAFSLTIVFGCTCAAPKNEPDPVGNWAFRPFDQYAMTADKRHYHLGQTVTEDYKTFIGTNGLDLLGDITGFYEDNTGQRAVEFEAFSRGQNAS